jgi:NAD(P)-dependent dehydrogenase (short-subunit alcohol dehydrogenase family)
MNLNGVGVVITGGASGLGAATAQLLASSGAKVTLFDMNADLGEKLAKEIGGIFCKVNVTNEEEVIAGFDAAAKAHGVTRVLVNCAGVGYAGKTASKGKPFPLQAFRTVLDINLIGSFSCIAQFAARLTEADPIGEERGVAINTASVAAFDGQIGQVAYSASKAGLVGMTLTIARDLADKGIRCLTIAPGLFETPLLGGLPDTVKDSLVAQTLFPKRLGRSPEYAHLAKAIIENAMLNGETIRLDGGIRMQPK